MPIPLNPKRPPKIRPEVRAKLEEKNPEQYIPKGIYCYDENGICPFWDLSRNHERQLNGYCHYMKIGDWMEDGNWLYLLWDQVKECDINDDREHDI